ncbi:class I SAM-dependent methyltransferase [Aciduricibacillus chroicocephali]|uniref:Class I SAM-dependent methyltransferase n=1 Tax=Aciduricibacillus chroicocephali TaxID=3054939 RepID=A0ABY9KSC3_9BACI|nr:class I SAM-dependent methyltransferase [Bacillaceae bacterium 44XB]
MAYEQLAQVYDAFMVDAPYDELLDFTCAVFNEYGKNVKNVADLGCGTGTMAIRLAQSKFSVQAVDYSADMLTAAEQQAAEAGAHIQFIHQDLRELAGLRNLDAAVSFFDVVNYVTEPEELSEMFKRVSSSLNDEGIFLFDVHSMHSIENHYAGETFSVIEDELCYVWFCEAGESPGEVYHDLTFFVREDDKYKRFDEYHHQRTYPIDFYESKLLEAGFKKNFWFGGADLKLKNMNEHASKIFILACK